MSMCKSLMLSLLCHLVLCAYKPRGDGPLFRDGQLLRLHILAYNKLSEVNDSCLLSTNMLVYFRVT